MKMNLTVDLSARKIAELTDQLSQKEFGVVRKLIETKARARFKSAMLRARGEFRRSGLSRRDVESALAEVRATRSK